MSPAQHCPAYIQRRAASAVCICMHLYLHAVKLARPSLHSWPPTNDVEVTQPTMALTADSAPLPACAGLLSMRTLVCKLLGVVCSMAGGLVAGKDLVHTGGYTPACLPYASMLAQHFSTFDASAACTLFVCRLCWPCQALDIGFGSGFLGLLPLRLDSQRCCAFRAPQSVEAS